MTNALAIFAAPARALIASDSKAGILLIAVAAAALIAANSPIASAYHGWFHDPLPWTPIPKLATAHLWINDGLMALFFFVIGLEVKREVVSGQLSTPEQRRLPMLAAAGGMVVPAAIFLAIAGGDPALTRGWAIPAATDIAFAMGVCGLLGHRVPANLRLFLLTVAIVDDIGAVLIIAVVYTSAIKFTWLLAAMIVFAAMVALGRSRHAAAWGFALLGAVLWYCILHSGVHATIAGVAAALAVPMGAPGEEPSLLEKMEHALAPWTSYLVVPLFGFANAGVSLAGLGAGSLLAPLPLGVAAGLAIGKQIGIFGCIAVADRLGYAARPAGASWIQIWGITALCGIGFTMSLFIGELAFPGVGTQAIALREQAKVGILAGSFVSAVGGYMILRLAARPSAEAPV
nr:Na+/H+ antiporter NhaA [Qipengyuania sediminis]